MTPCFRSLHSYEDGSVPSEALVEFGLGSQNFRTGLFLPGHACSLLIPFPASPWSLEFSQPFSVLATLEIRSSQGIIYTSQDCPPLLSNKQINLL